MQHLILRLESPLMAFGGETVDYLGVIRRFPSASMITGLLANALGWRRVERERHQRLQDRLVFASRIDREPAGGLRMTDFQTAQLGANDRGWTTRGMPDERAGGAGTYNSPHLRYRDYFADMQVTVALRLGPDSEEPTLEDLAQALQEPARPLFIGRKPCLPSAPLFGGFSDGDTALAALLGVSLEEGRNAPERISLMWPDGEGDARAELDNAYMLTDQRNWVSGLHGGGRFVHEGVAAPGKFGCIAESETPAEPEEEAQPVTSTTTVRNVASVEATLQMVRAEISGRDFQRWMGNRRLQDPDHAMHCLLKECFGDLAPKPFRVIMPRDGSNRLPVRLRAVRGGGAAGSGGHLRRASAGADYAIR